MIKPITGDDIFKRVIFKADAPGATDEEGSIYETFSQRHPDFVAVRFVSYVHPYPEPVIKIVDCKRERLRWKK